MHDPPATDLSTGPDDAAIDAMDVAHRLRTPLTTIRGHAQLARRRLHASAVPADEAATIDDCLGAIDDAVERLDRSIDEVLHHDGAG